MMQFPDYFSPLSVLNSLARALLWLTKYYNLTSRLSSVPGLICTHLYDQGYIQGAEIISTRRLQRQAPGQRLMRNYIKVKQATSPRLHGHLHRRPGNSYESASATFGTPYPVYLNPQLICFCRLFSHPARLPPLPGPAVLKISTEVNGSPSCLC
jgi:hypothetical protein